MDLTRVCQILIPLHVRVCHRLHHPVHTHHTNPLHGERANVSNSEPLSLQAQANCQSQSPDGLRQAAKLRGLFV